MSKCDISIELDDPKSTYQLGDTVTGTVKIQVNKDVNCNALKITGLWKTHGRGNTDSCNYGDHIAFEGLMHAGEVKTIPFSILIEGVPLTYRGEYLNIDHYIDVRIDIPWSIDPKASEEFLVLPGGIQEIEEPLNSDPNTSSALLGCAIFTLMASLICYLGYLNLADEEIKLGSMIMGVVFLVLFICIVVSAILKRLRERKLGLVSVEMDTYIVTPNSSVPCKIGFSPLKPIEVNGVTAKLTATEVVTSGSGTDKTTHRKQLFEEITNLSDYQLFQPYQSTEISGDICIPDTMAYSFESSDNQLHWELALHMDVSNCPDWKYTANLKLVPHEHVFGDPIAEAEDSSMEHNQSDENEKESPEW
jgi:hypothetical protein